MLNVIKTTKRIVKFAAKHNIVFVMLTALNAYLAIKGLRTVDLSTYYAVRIIAPITLIICFGWIFLKLKNITPKLKKVFKNFKRILNTLTDIEQETVK